MDARSLTALADALPEGASVTLSRAELVELAAEIRADRLAPEPTAVVDRPEPPTSWRERLWDAPSETRLTVPEVAEALGRSTKYVHTRTGPSADPAEAIPRRKDGGRVVVLAGELRRWVRDREGEVGGAPSDPPGPRLRAM